MNIDFNKLLQNSKPFLYVILISYFINIILFFYLPKSGATFLKDSSSNLEYKKYGFYSNSKKINANEKSFEQKNDKPNIQSLSKYDLKGIYSTIDNKGWIIIEEKTTANSSYVLSQGEQIDGYTLFKLFKDYVIFQKDKKEYKLEIVDKDISSLDSSKNVIKEDIVVKNNGAVVSRDYLNSYITNLDKIWNNITISEVKNEDRIDGFKIDKVNKDSAFSKLGLKEGDVIKTVNNIQMNSHAEALKVFSEMNNIKNLNIQVLRNNELVEMNYEVN